MCESDRADKSGIDRVNRNPKLFHPDWSE